MRDCVINTSKNTWTARSTRTGANFWSLLKRAITGTYVSVEPFHIFRYLDEQAYRFNYRKVPAAERFRGVLAHTTGHRLTYAELIATANAQA